MKVFLKVFAISFIIFVLVFSVGVMAFNTLMKEDSADFDEVVARVEEDDHYDKDVEEIDELLRLVQESNRINFIVLGLDDTRSDMMMFVSFDPDEKRMDGISIPRDTYYPRQGYTGPGKKKINAAHGDHGANGVKTVVTDILFDVPVDYYITMTYQGVGAIVNSLGGVPVHISKPMIYDDPYDNPPLHINFAAGNHVLKGPDAVKFLRYRQPNPGSGALDRHGDIGRIDAQQEFIQSAISKAMGPRLPSVAGQAFRHVRTDIDLQDVMRLATAAVGMDMANVQIATLPGEASYQGGVSYYFHDPEATRDRLMEIYKGSTEE
ncbi:cell envelope-related transcriptional attenuator [Alkaliphilus metalliredigens QYMF]|uniref:Cell envelope-related transcriptional attenuator n=1 Tax=Alkaliphilus metalliredigens (strain QYMF) TaxID=293826 RepID=A6TJM1_ALKMQ|nr:LCP family protein [Alkaliphilus metalliredigens]ABR46389.1 cell envelope-related transcriptional attenuator [Alkaliphilus metalliredigens QYMF]